MSDNLVGLEGSWSGLDGLGDDVLKELRPKAEATVERVAMFFAGEVKQTLRGQRHGRRYRVPQSSYYGGRRKKATWYTASAPGEAPAVRLGGLRRSIVWTPPVWVGDGVLSTVGTNMHYARRLEYGGAHRAENGTLIHIAARPYWAPTMLRIQERVTRMFEEGM